MVNILIVDDHLLMRRAVREVVEKEGDLTVVAEASNGFEAEEQAAQTQPDVVLMDLDMPGCDGFEATERVLARSPQSRVVIFTASHEERHVFQAIQRGAMGYITKDIDPEALIHAIRCAARNDLCIPGSLATQVLAHMRLIWRSQSYLASSRRAASAAIAYRTPRRSRARTAIPVTTTTEAVTEIETKTETETEVTPESIEEATSSDSTEMSETPEQQQAPPPLPTIRPLTEREQEILDLMRKGRKNREIAGELAIAESTVHKHVQNIFEKLHARNRTEAIYFTSAEEE